MVTCLYVWQIHMLKHASFLHFQYTVVWETICITDYSLSLFLIVVKSPNNPSVINFPLIQNCKEIKNIRWEVFDRV